MKSNTREKIIINRQLTFFALSKKMVNSNGLMECI